MANDCYPGVYYELIPENEGTEEYVLRDHWGVPYDPTTWVQKLLEASDDQMCDTKHELEGLIEAAAVTKPAVLAAFSAPLPTITAALGGSPVVVTVLGISVLSGTAGPIIQNLMTRVNDLEDRLQSLGYLT